MAQIDIPPTRSQTKLELRKAFSRIGPPTHEMVFDEDMLSTSRLVEEHARGYGKKLDNLQTQIERAQIGDQLLSHNGPAAGIPGLVERRWPSFIQLLEGLYLPEDAKPAWIPAQQRYSHTGAWPGKAGSAFASKSSGKLTAIQMVNLNARQESTWAGVYVILNTDVNTHGQVSRITFEPEINWKVSDIFDVNHVWNARIDGYVWFTANLWVAAYELNQATGRFEAINGPSAAVHQLWQSSWHINSGGRTGRSGSLQGNLSAYKFIASPARTYLVGVVAEMRVSHSLKNVDGGRIPEPGQNDFVAYGMVKADVPAMWVQHEVLAR